MKPPDNSPKISVIVPNYNHALFLKQRMDSVFNQTYNNFEVIILDDCSTDDSRKIIEKYRNHPKVSHIIYNDQNTGSPFIQWKKGVAHAKGEWIWIAESDDYCEENFLETSIISLENNKADLFYCKSIYSDEKKLTNDNLKNWYADLSLNRWENNYCSDAVDEIKNFLSIKNTIPNASAVVFKNRNDVAGIISEASQFKFCGDWYFWIRFLSNSRKISYSVQTCNYFRYHAGSTRSETTKKKRNSEVLRIFSEVGKKIKTEKKRYLAHYYFSKHLYVYPKYEWWKNFRIFFLSMFTSVCFFRSWKKYFISDNK